MKKSVLAAVLLLFTACTNDPFNDYNNNNIPSGGGGTDGGGSSSGVMDMGTLNSFDVAIDTTALEETEVVPTDETDSDYAQYVETNFSAAYTISVTYKGSSATVTGQADGDTVTVDGANVEVRAHNKGMTLSVTGTTTAGSLKVYSDKKFELLLKDAAITSTDGAAINIQDGKCFVVLEGTNTLSDASQATYTTTDDEDSKAVFFSEDDLRFSGSGSLTVNALNAVGKNAVTSDDDVFIRPHTRLLLTAASSAGNGLKSKGDIIMKGGVVNVTTAAAGSKALKSESNIKVSGGRLTAITSGGVDTSDSSDPSGCAALKADSAINIAGGSLWLKSSGQGGKGISSDTNITIAGGETWVVTTGSQYGSSSNQKGGQTGGGGGMHFIGGWGGNTGTSSTSVSPKGIRADSNITISGGNVYVRTAGSNAEGIESKATLTLAGGNTAVSAYDDGMNAAAISVTGGRSFVISTGSCDGVDSNGTLNCSGGLLIGVASTLSSEDGLDCESSMTITGGTMVGFSNGGMTQSARITGRYFTTTVSGSVSSYVALCSGSTPISVFALPRTYSSGRMIYLSGELSSGTYTLLTGTTPAGGSLWMNYYEGATSVSGGTSSSVKL